MFNFQLEGVCKTPSNYQLINTQVKLSANITKITYDNDIYTIEDSHYDHLVIATNARHACGFLKNIPEILDSRQERLDCRQCSQ